MKENLFKIVLSDLALEELVLQAKIEEAVNSDKSIDEKIKEIKYLLRGIVITELMFQKFTSMTTKD